MFDSRDDALDFRDEIVQQLVGMDSDIDGFHVKPTLDGTTIKIGDGEPRVRGKLSGQGFNVAGATPDDLGGWAAVLEVHR